jgi:hypothetical protein
VFQADANQRNTLRDRQALNGGDDEDPGVVGNRAGRGGEAMTKGSRWARRSLRSLSIAEREEIPADLPQVTHIGGSPPNLAQRRRPG